MKEEKITDEVLHEFYDSIVRAVKEMEAEGVVFISPMIVRDRVLANWFTEMRELDDEVLPVEAKRIVGEMAAVLLMEMRKEE